MEDVVKTPFGHVGKEATVTHFIGVAVFERGIEATTGKQAIGECLHDANKCLPFEV